MESIKLDAARDAVNSLGLVTSDAIPTIAGMIQDEMSEHPRKVCTAYRQQGAQVPRETKKNLGVRANGFLSEPALAEITELGRSAPLAAHETTLLRAQFTFQRHRNREQFAKLTLRNMVGIEHSTHHLECEGCNAIDGLVTTPEAAHVFPPPGCKCTGSYVIRPKIDWFMDAD